MSSNVPSYMNVLPDGTQAYKGTARTPTSKPRPYYVIPGAGPRPRKRRAAEDDENDYTQPAAKKLRHSEPTTKVMAASKAKQVSKPTPTSKAAPTSKTTAQATPAPKPLSIPGLKATVAPKTKPTSHATPASEAKKDQAKTAPATKLANVPAPTKPAAAGNKARAKGLLSNKPALSNQQQPRITILRGLSRSTKRKSTAAEDDTEPKSVAKKQRLSNDTTSTPRPEKETAPKEQDRLPAVAQSTTETRQVPVKQLAPTRKVSGNETKAPRHAEDRTRTAKSPANGDASEDKPSTSSPEIDDGTTRKKGSPKSNEAVATSNGGPKRKGLGASLDDGAAWPARKKSNEAAPPQRTGQSTGKTAAANDSDSDSEPQSEEDLTPLQKKQRRRRAAEKLRKNRLAKQARKEFRLRNSSSSDPSPETTPPTSSPEAESAEQKAPSPDQDDTNLRPGSSSSSNNESNGNDFEDLSPPKRGESGLTKSQFRKKFIKD